MTFHFRFEKRQLVELLDAMADHTVPLAPLLGVEPPAWTDIG